MKYCLNIEDLRKNIIYRLDKNKDWKICTNPTEIGENDFISIERQTILDLQVEDEAITIDKKKYKINSTGIVDFFAMEDLNYVVYGFRDIHPSPPIRKQLEQTLLKGDDSKTNTLILKTDGNFYLVESTSISFNKCDPEIVVQFEAFVGGNGYVGPTIKDQNFDKYTEEYFRTGMSYWRDHLGTKELHEQSDLHQGENLDDLLDIYDDLEKIKNDR